MSQLSYQQCYDILSLPQDADWSEASLAYRKLVQRWHPDRYEGNDNKMAEDRFVQLTVAFNKLRDYHRNHHALPFIDVDLESRPASNDDSHGGTSAGPQSYPDGEPAVRQSTNTYAKTDAYHSDIRRDSRNRSEHAARGFSTATKLFAMLVLFGLALVTLLYKMDNRDLQKLQDDRREHRAIVNNQ